jgi:hypothetical protein
LLHEVLAYLTWLISQRCYLRGLHLAQTHNYASEVRHRRLRRAQRLFYYGSSEPREAGDSAPPRHYFAYRFADPSGR